MKLENVIDARLKMQSTERALQEYGLTIETANDLKVSSFINKFNSLSDDNKKSVIKIIGGHANFAKTNKYLNELLSEGVVA